MASILGDEYWLNIEFQGALYLNFLKSAFKSDPEATREYIKERMARGNIPITPLIAAILPEDAELILQNLTDYKSVYEKDALDIFEYSAVTKSYKESSDFGSLNQLSSNRRIFRDSEYIVNREQLKKVSIFSKSPTSIFVDLDDNDIKCGGLSQSFASEIVTIELSIKDSSTLEINLIEKLQNYFPNLKHISLSMSVAQKTSEFEEFIELCAEFNITIDVDQLSEAKSKHNRKSHGISEIQSRQNEPKPGEIFLGNAEEEYKLDSSNEKQSFQMQFSGKVLNNDFSIKPKIISAVKTMTVSDYIDFEVVSANEFQTIVIPNLTSEQIVEFTSSQSSSKLYASLNVSLRGGERKFLPCLSFLMNLKGL